MPQLSSHHTAQRQTRIVIATVLCTKYSIINQAPSDKPITTHHNTHTHTLSPQRTARHRPASQTRQEAEQHPPATTTTTPKKKPNHATQLCQNSGRPIHEDVCECASVCLCAHSSQTPPPPPPPPPSPGYPASKGEEEEEETL